MPQKNWDKYEVALLIEAYQNIKKGKVDKNTALVTLSRNLRQMAVNRSYNIDEEFRNFSDICSQTTSLEVAFGLIAETDTLRAPVIFVKMVDLYNTDSGEYQYILQQAHDLLKIKLNMTEKERCDDFVAWLDVNDKIAPEVVVRNLNYISEYANKHGIVQKNIWALTSVKELNVIRVKISGNKFFKITHKREHQLFEKSGKLYADYLKESAEKIKQIKQVIMAQAQETERSAQIVSEETLTALAEKSLTADNIAVVEQKPDIYEPFLVWMLKNTDLSEQTARGYISALITLSKWAIAKGLMHKEVLGITACEEFVAIEEKIKANSDYIQFNMEGHNRFSAALNRYKEFLGGEKTQGVSIPGIIESQANNVSDLHKKRVRRGVSIKDAEEYLKGKGLNGATVQEIVDAIQPSAAVYPTRISLDTSNNVIAMPHDRYVYADAFVDLDEAEEILQHILTVHFSQFEGYSNNKLLYGAASHDLSMFLNDNDCDDLDSVYALARHFFEKKENRDGYIFSNPHIFAYSPDHPLNLKGVMMHYARNNGGVLVADDAETYLQKTLLSYGGMGQLLGIAVSDTFLIYDSDRYILSKVLGVNGEWSITLHDRLDELFRQANVAFVIPRDINDMWLQSLPELPHGLPWTILLLQEAIKKFPKIGFKIITSDLTQSYDTVAAAFVPADSPLQSFADIIALYMSGKYALPKRMSCDELRQELLRAGIIAGNELIYALPRALNDYRFSWTDGNRTVLVRGN